MVSVEGEVPAPWAPALENVCDSLSRLPDLDPAARARVTMASPKVKVSVQLTDGRTAERRIANPERLVPTLEALMVVPRLPQKAVAPIESEPVRRPLRPLESPPMISAPPDDSPRAIDAAQANFELGAAFGARIGRDMAFSPQVFANYHIADWRLGAALRWDPSFDEPEPFGPNRGGQRQTFVGELQLARHFDVFKLGVDLGVSPRLALTLPTARVDLRGGAFARIGVRVGDVNFFAVLDGEVARTPGLNPASPFELTGGIALGAAWLGQ